MKSILKKIIPSFLKTAAKKFLNQRKRTRLHAEGKALSQVDFEKGFREMGIAPGDTLLIHSSLSKFGQVEGGPATIILALQNVVGVEGTLLFPAFSLKSSMVETLSNPNYVFDPLETPSQMGRITEVFRTMPGVKRSLHPTHSIAVWGKRRDWFLDDEDMNFPTNFGQGTPMGKLHEVNGKVVGLGIKMDFVTYYHSFEDFRLDQFPGVYEKERMPASVKLDGKIVRTSILVHAPAFHSVRIEKDPRIETMIRNYFTETGRRKVAKIGPAESWAIEANAFIEGLEELLSKGLTIYTVPPES
jgi:aminoglycoside 3-N-acetyltransferase